MYRQPYAPLGEIRINDDDDDACTMCNPCKCCRNHRKTQMVQCRLHLLSIPVLISYCSLDLSSGVT